MTRPIPLEKWPLNIIHSCATIYCNEPFVNYLM